MISGGASTARRGLGIYQRWDTRGRESTSENPLLAGLPFPEPELPAAIAAPPAQPPPQPQELPAEQHAVVTPSANDLEGLRAFVHATGGKFTFPRNREAWSALPATARLKLADRNPQLAERLGAD